MAAASGLAAQLSEMLLDEQWLACLIVAFVVALVIGLMELD